jgi:nicotinamidase-related amidase
MRSVLLAIFLTFCALAAMTLPVRNRTPASPGSNEGRAVVRNVELKPEKTAIIVCDMWDRHWCRGASQRVEALARKMNPLLERARHAGILIVHAPSETMEYYRNAPQRAAMLAIGKATLPTISKIQSPPLPIDDSDGGCDTPGDQAHRVWTRQSELLTIGPDDLISDSGSEIYSAVRGRGITTVLIMGVHTNMCVLNRSFGIKQLTQWKFNVYLVRDMTDAMYDPADRPFVTHDQGTQLVIEHIEQHWCPSVLSLDVLKTLK